MLTAAVLTVSDKGSRGEREDLSGPAAKEILQKDNWNVIKLDIVPDEKQMIKEKLMEYADKLSVNVVFTSGGTGFSTRDVTPDATLSVIERETPGITEAMRMESLKKTPRAMLSRAVAGIRKKTIIINLPGSPKGVRECMEIVLPSIKHGVEILNGQTSECGRE